MNIYENFVVGSFLFGLGAEMALRHIGRPMPPVLAALSQQTKWDESLGDVVLRNGGVFRLLEFKREANKSRKEIVKLWMLKKSLRSKAFTSADADHLKILSRKIHWYVEIPRGFTTQVRVVPYLDFRIQSGYIELAQFVKETAEQASTPWTREEDVNDYGQYLQLLCRCRGSASSGALLLLISAGGQIQFEPVDDIRDVILPRSEVLQRERELKMEHELRREISQTLAVERVINHRTREDHDMGARQELRLDRGYGIRH